MWCESVVISCGYSQGVWKWQMAADDPIEQLRHSAAAGQAWIDRLQHTQSIKCTISSVHKALCTILMSDRLCKLSVVHTEKWPYISPYKAVFPGSGY